MAALGEIGGGPGVHGLDRYATPAEERARERWEDQLRLQAKDLRRMADALDQAATAGDADQIHTVSLEICGVSDALTELWSTAVDDGFAREDREYAARQAAKLSPVRLPGDRWGHAIP